MRGGRDAKDPYRGFHGGVPVAHFVLPSRRMQIVMSCPYTSRASTRQRSLLSVSFSRTMKPYRLVEAMVSITVPGATDAPGGKGVGRRGLGPPAAVAGV